MRCDYQTRKGRNGQSRRFQLSEPRKWRIAENGIYRVRYSTTVANSRNGDVYSYTDFYDAIDHSKVDTCMIARGAIVKPWIFEEIQVRQHLDKSATERLDMLRQFTYWGLEHWVGSSDRVTNNRVRIHLESLLLGDSFVSL
jgi:tRNA-dihydrouridine synthase